MKHLQEKSQLAQEAGYLAQLDDKGECCPQRSWRSLAVSGAGLEVEDDEEDVPPAQTASSIAKAGRADSCWLC